MNGYLLVYSKKPKEELEYKIKFEELGFDTVKKRVTTANIPFFIFLAFIALNVGLLIDTALGNEPLPMLFFWLLGAAFFSGLAFYANAERNKEMIYLTGGTKILELLAAKPNIAEVQEFINHIHLAIRKYYKDKFTQFNDPISYEAKIAQLKWLREMEAITDDEYKSLTSEAKTDRIIGFRREENNY